MLTFPTNPVMWSFIGLLWPIAAVMAAANAMGLVIAYGGRHASH